MISLQLFLGFFLGVLCIDWRFDALLQTNPNNDEVLRKVYSYYWTVQSGGHVKHVMNGCLGATTLLLSYRAYVEKRLEIYIVLGALLCGAVYFLSGVRPAAEKLRLVSPSVSEEKDKKLAKSILQKIRNGHIVLFFLVLLSLFILPDN